MRTWPKTLTNPLIMPNRTSPPPDRIVKARGRPASSQPEAVSNPFASFGTPAVEGTGAAEATTAPGTGGDGSSSTPETAPANVSNPFEKVVLSTDTAAADSTVTLAPTVAVPANKSDLSAAGGTGAESSNDGDGHNAAAGTNGDATIAKSDAGAVAEAAAEAAATAAAEAISAAETATKVAAEAASLIDSVQEVAGGAPVTKGATATVIPAEAPGQKTAESGTAEETGEGASIAAVPATAEGSKEASPSEGTQGKVSPDSSAVQQGNGAAGENGQRRETVAAGSRSGQDEKSGEKSKSAADAVPPAAAGTLGAGGGGIVSFAALGNGGGGAFQVTRTGGGSLLVCMGLLQDVMRMSDVFRYV